MAIAGPSLLREAVTLTAQPIGGKAPAKEASAKGEARSELSSPLPPPSSGVEDARDLLNLALELVEDDNGYCEMTRLMESVARAYLALADNRKAVIEECARVADIAAIAALDCELAEVDVEARDRHVLRGKVSTKIAEQIRSLTK